MLDAQHAFIRRIIMHWDKVQDREAWPWRLDAFRDLESLPLDSGVTIFVGENGSGKSTLIESIAYACGMNVEGGGRNFSFHTFPERAALSDALRLVRGTRRPATDFFLRAESLFNALTYEEQLGGGGGRLSGLHRVSHGEAFLKLVVERFSGDGLYIFDEPEAALSPQGILALLRKLHFLAQDHCQIIIATHSPILMAMPGATVYHLGTEGIAPVDYRSTSHYAITKRFLLDPEGFLGKLFAEDGE